MYAYARLTPVHVQACPAAVNNMRPLRCSLPSMATLSTYLNTARRRCACRNHSQFHVGNDTISQPYGIGKYTHCRPDTITYTSASGTNEPEQPLSDGHPPHQTRATSTESSARTARTRTAATRARPRRRTGRRSSRAASSRPAGRSSSSRSPRRASSACGTSGASRACAASRARSASRAASGSSAAAAPRQGAGARQHRAKRCV